MEPHPGTKLLKDIATNQNDLTLGELTVVGRSFTSCASDAAHGSELWKSDGTSSGTKLVKDIFSERRQLESRKSHRIGQPAVLRC